MDISFVYTDLKKENNYIKLSIFILYTVWTEWKNIRENNTKARFLHPEDEWRVHKQPCKSKLALPLKHTSDAPWPPPPAPSTYAGEKFKYFHKVLWTLVTTQDEWKEQQLQF